MSTLSVVQASGTHVVANWTTDGTGNRTQLGVFSVDPGALTYDNDDWQDALWRLQDNQDDINFPGIAGTHAIQPFEIPEYTPGTMYYMVLQAYPTAAVRVPFTFPAAAKIYTTDDSGWNIRTWMLGSEVDLSPDVTDVQISFGGHRPNVAGALLPPAIGTITLNNAFNRYSTLNPDSDIDTEPGPPVYVEYGGERLFTGWSNGMVQTDQDENHLSVLNLLGPVSRIQGYHRKLFLDLAGEHTIDSVIGAALDNVEFPRAIVGSWPDIGSRKIATSTTRVHAHGLEQSGITFNGREQVEILQAIQSLVQLELGRAYDDEYGNIVFVPRDRVWSQNIDRFDTVSTAHDFRRRKIEPASRGVVNIIETRQSAFSEGGSGDVPVVPNLPAVMTVPAGGIAEITFRIDTSEWDYVSWDIPVAGTNYTCPIAPGFEFTEQRITFSITNNTSVEVSLSILQLTGARFRASGQRVLPVRDDESIKRYGYREITLNTLPYVDTREQLDFARYMIAILATGGHFATVTYLTSDVIAKIGDSFEVDLGRGLQVWAVDGVTYERSGRKNILRTTLQLARPQDPQPLEYDYSNWNDFRLTYA